MRVLSRPLSRAFPNMACSQDPVIRLGAIVTDLPEYDPLWVVVRSGRLLIQQALLCIWTLQRCSPIIAVTDELLIGFLLPRSWLTGFTKMTVLVCISDRD